MQSSSHMSVKVCNEEKTQNTFSSVLDSVSYEKRQLGYINCFFGCQCNQQNFFCHIIDINITPSFTFFT